MSVPHSTEQPKRIVVWVQNCGDRPHLDLRWHDPVTGKPQRRSSGTCNPLHAEGKRADLEYELNPGLYPETSRMAWEAFRELFEREYMALRRPGTRKKCAEVFDLFEELCGP